MRRKQSLGEVWDEVWAKMGLKRIPVGHQKPTDPDTRRQWALADKAIARMVKEGKLKPPRNGQRKPTSGSRRRPR